MKRTQVRFKIISSLIKTFVFAFVLFGAKQFTAQNNGNKNTSPSSNSAKKNPYDLKASNIKDSIVYDAKNRRYLVYTKIGNRYSKTPTVYTFNEYWQLRNREAENKYFKDRANAISLLNRPPTAKAKIDFKESLLNRFLPGQIKIEPQGNLNVLLGYQRNTIKNPTLPERSQRNGNLLFEPNMQVNVNANIGDKMKFPINFNTQSNYDFDNQIKIDYAGKSDEIVKRFQAGNLNFQTRSQLIPGVQQLWGLGTNFQFGKLYMNFVLAQQKSQRQTTNLNGGASLTPFEVKADEYEENRHFLLGGYFENNFNTVMSKIPAVTTPMQILRVEVWKTNRYGMVNDNRNIIAFADLGETQPFNQNLNPIPNALPSNNANNLYQLLLSNPTNREAAQVVSNIVNLPGYNFQSVQDFEKTFAQKLDSSQYTVHRQLGYISLNQTLAPDEVLAVAYQYTYNGKVYQVGEFANDLGPDTANGNQKTLFLKMLKATAQRTKIPMWRWMMKNVYSIGYGQLNRDGFEFGVYYQEPNGGTKPIVPFGSQNQGQLLITQIGADRLNNRTPIPDPMPDGQFDFVERFTVVSDQSRIIFPVLEPFGRDLAKAIYGNNIPADVRDTLYYALYDTIKEIARQAYPQLNRFVLKGRTKGGVSRDEIPIGFNIPRGSVQVTAGGRLLQENIDYEINYDYGTLRILNPAIKNSGTPIQINSENTAAFAIQQRGFVAARLEYLAKQKLREHLSYGATFAQLSERPFFTKVDYNEDPIRNRLYGFDINYQKETPRVTKFINKLYPTTAPSKINFQAEMAYFDPGHAPQIGRGSKGLIYLDNFDASRSLIDIRFPAVAWSLASTPKQFPESNLTNNLNYNQNRAKLSWYQIEPTLQNPDAPNYPTGMPRAEAYKSTTRQVLQREIFPQRTTDFSAAQWTTFDLTYYPKERGPYNYTHTGLNTDGSFQSPQTKWGGLMRGLDQIDFETANIEFMEFWVLDPYVNNPNSTNTGNFYINLGNISEDILKDGKRFYENGLPTPTSPQPIENSIWGRVPNNPIQINNAFSNEPSDRAFQDVGFDGLVDSLERIKFAPFLNAINSSSISAAAKAKLNNDPSSDNYVHFRDPSFNNSTTSILERYKNFNGPHGNSPLFVNSTGNASGDFSSAATLFPDAEDLNRDNTLNESEEYFQYRVEFKPNMQIGSNFIVDKKIVKVPTGITGQTRDENWYLFRIPLLGYESKVGSIPDFKSIRFIRMFLTGFKDTVTLRFGTFQLVRNQWRRFQYQVDYTGRNNPLPQQSEDFTVGAVNIEENDAKFPLPYRTPKEIIRVQTLGNNGVNLLLNEQSMSFRFNGLQQNEARGVFQTYTNRDLTQFKQMKMFIHAEPIQNGCLTESDDISAVIRLGNDFVSNYYEIKIPLKLSPITQQARDLALQTGAAQRDKYDSLLWDYRNSLDIEIQKLVDLKQLRENANAPLNQIFSKPYINGQTISIMGQPNLAELKGILIAVENTKQPEGACAEVWFNELRLSSIIEKGGFAALARLDLTLADLANVTVSANMHTPRFGNLEQRINDRTRDNYLQVDASAQINAEKLLGKVLPVQSVPVYVAYNQSKSDPLYDAFDRDRILKDKIKALPAGKRDSVLEQSTTLSKTTTVAVSNFKFKPGKKNRFFNPSNFDIGASSVTTINQNPIIELNEIKRKRGQIGYAYNPSPKYIMPFKPLFKKSKSKWFDILKDFNFNLIPDQLAVKAEIIRQFASTKPRIVGVSGFQIPETYDKFFTFDRNYIVRLPFTKSITLDFSAINNARVDEPFGRINTPEKKKEVKESFWRGGRNTLYNQSLKGSYKLPIYKIPAFSWLDVSANYQADYSWTGASRVALELGNFAENRKQQGANVTANLETFYSKSKWLRALEEPKGEKQKPTYIEKTDSVFKTVVKDGKKVKQFVALKTKKIKQKPAVPYVGTIPRIFGNLLTMVKTATFSATENQFTRLPGFMDSSRNVGMNWRSMAPGLDFVLGVQPNKAWLERAASKKWLSDNISFNDMFRQGYTQTLQGDATIRPFRDFNITVNLTKTFQKNYEELYKDTVGGTNKFVHLSPYSSGSFDVSYISFQTLFQKKQPGELSQVYKRFLDNRIILSKRLGQANPYSQQVLSNGYYKGYNKYAVDVLLPSFVAAYSNKDANTISLLNQNETGVRTNPFKGIKALPNWRLDYNGLSRIKGLDKIFNSFNLSHSYKGGLTMNGFTSALLYQDIFNLNYPSFFDTISQNFVPYFLVPNITLSENFAPLIGTDIQFNNQLQLRFEYSKSRNVSLSLIDFQISENNTTSYTVGAGYRKKGLRLPFKLPKFLNKDGGDKLDNEINFKFDMTMRDNSTFNTRLDQNVEYATAGSKQFELHPSIEYFLSNKVSLKLFYDIQRISPYISTTPPTSNMRGGLQINVSLAQ